MREEQGIELQPIKSVTEKYIDQQGGYYEAYNYASDDVRRLENSGGDLEELEQAKELQRKVLDEIEKMLERELSNGDTNLDQQRAKCERIIREQGDKDVVLHKIQVVRVNAAQEEVQVNW